VLTSQFSDYDALLDCLNRDRTRCLEDAALALEYDGKKDLKPPPSLSQRWLAQLATAATARNRRSVDWASALLTDVAVDNNGNIKPTALHFTAGQQQFLQMVDELRKRVTLEDLSEAILGPWKYERPLPVMGWDSTSARDYALRASNPSTDKKMGVPGADWLAVRGLTFLSVVPRKTRIATTGCGGGWKNGHFQWPLWTVSLTSDVVRTILRIEWQVVGRQERIARGIGAVFSCGIKRSDQGGYGSFEPASPR
jgi:hypothetical protein